jgi:hypothetical protein
VAYNSLEHFLREHEPGFVAVMEAAQRATGGHYAAMTPAQLHANAAADVQHLLQSIRQATLDRGAIQKAAEQTGAAGINLDDLTRMSNALDRGLVAYVEAELGSQPELCADLLRRIRHVTASYRSNVTSVKLDSTLKRLQQP